MKRVHFLFGGVLACVVVLSACATMTANTSNPVPDQTTLVDASSLKANQKVADDGVDIQETTASLQVLPSFLNNAPANVVQAYKTAAQNIDLLKWIPCYCGCGDSAGHLNNLQCFINKVNPDGSVVWDNHGSKCDTCMQIAINAAKMKQQGRSIKQIREVIDSTYDQGFGKPTPTPMPE